MDAVLSTLLALGLPYERELGERVEGGVRSRIPGSLPTTEPLEQLSVERASRCQRPHSVPYIASSLSQ